jgi:hypothetical protein
LQQMLTRSNFRPKGLPTDTAHLLDRAPFMLAII